MTPQAAEPVAAGRVAPPLSETARAADDPLGASVRGLLRRLLRPGTDTAPPHTLGLTGCSGGEGVSTVAARLAAAAAVAGPGPVLLADAHLARPAAHKLLSVSAAPGLADALRDGTPLPQLLQPSPVARLSVLAAGRADDDPVAVWDSPGLTGLLETLKEEFALIVWDLPPAAGRSPAAGLAALLDGLVLVVEAERTLRETARREKECLNSQARLLGVVLNKRRTYAPGWLDRVP